MRAIITNDGWKVLAQWHGAERVVWTGRNVFDAIRFMRSHRKEQV